jgi:hypothetical protein
MKSYQFYTKLVFSWLLFVASFAISTSALAQCNNVTFGGTVCCNQPSNLPFDPQPIVETAPATGGSGSYEYQWLYTTNPFNTNFSQWNMIPGGTGKNYDPGYTTATTFFVRCVRAVGCTDFIKESNVIIVTVSPCDNITDGGKINANQIGCNAGNGYDPNPFVNATSPSGGTGSGAIEYAWYKSTVGGAFNINSSNWTQIPGANGANYDSPIITATTYFVRVARTYNLFRRCKWFYQFVSKRWYTSLHLFLELWSDSCEYAKSKQSSSRHLYRNGYRCCNLYGYANGSSWSASFFSIVI